MTDLEQPAVNYVYRATVLRCVDGDTFELRLDRGFDDFSVVMCRLHGCDTPESRGVERAAGEWVTRQVLAWIGEDPEVIVRSMVYRRDMYGRALFRLWHQGRDLTAWLLQKGYAWPTDDHGRLTVPRSIAMLRLPDGIVQAVREAMA